MAKVLVTGGQGFIGSNLVPELESRNNDVWVCDLGQSSREKYIRCDVGKYRQLERIFETHEFDYVYHLAAEYGRWNGEDYYENLWQTNVIGTKNMLRVQEQKKFRMIFFSSAEVYGDHMIDEGDYQAFAWIRDNVDDRYEKAVLEPWKGAPFAAVTGKHVYSWISAYPTERDIQARDFFENDCRDTAFLKQNGVSIVYTRWVCDNPDLVRVRKYVYLLELEK